MSDFSEALKFVLENEGGLLIDKHTGEVSKYGITAKFLKSIKMPYDPDSVKKLDLADAEMIYKKYFWDEYGLERIRYQPLANKCLDVLVNLGGPRGAKLIQRAIANAGYPIKVDGILGPYTVGVLNLDSAKILNFICAEQEKYYRRLARNPKYSKYLRGWIKRARRK